MAGANVAPSGISSTHGVEASVTKTMADGKVLPSSYLAVDLFLLLSGFVIAQA